MGYAFRTMPVEISLPITHIDAEALRAQIYVTLTELGRLLASLPPPPECDGSSESPQ